MVVGAGAAGLMAAIWARRTHPRRSVLLLDGARKLGAKILVSGGGRCNVTHERVDAGAFAGASQPSIAKVLRRFDVQQVVAFFDELGVQLKREETGKLFAVTDRARTVLDALLRTARDAGVAIEHPRRVERMERAVGVEHVERLRAAEPAGRAEPAGDSGFRAVGEWGSVEAARVILATGGRSLPKSGSDGHGYALAQSLGHTLTRRIFPALVPLLLPQGHVLRSLAGVATPARVEVRSGSGHRWVALTGPLLCTHFGVSGPVVLDISRHLLAARFEDPRAGLWVAWLPDAGSAELDAQLRGLGTSSVLSLLRGRLPERLLRALCAQAGMEPGARGCDLTREQRKRLVGALLEMPLPVAGDRGFGEAEVTAGGVPLSELRLETMESRQCGGLYLCGEICDVDGRIGGFNFQWAWASGYVAGVSAAMG